MQKEAGNALLITMVVITVVGSVGFGVSRIAISALRQQNRLEDSANAYQAAMAGIEDGLLRWRFNKNTEVPARGSGADCPGSPTTTSQLYTRINLSTTDPAKQVKHCIDPSQEPTPSPNEIVYDLKLHYRKDPGEPERVESTTSPTGKIPALKRDEIIEYNVEGVPTDNGGLKLSLKPEGENAIDGDIVEVIGLEGSGYKRVFLRNEIDNMRGNPQRLRLTPETSSIRLKYQGQDVDWYELQPPPPTSPEDTRSAIDSRISTVEATGYFGTTKRKLKLSLDRKTGSLLSLFDYALFSGESGIEPPTTTP